MIRYTLLLFLLCFISQAFAKKVIDIKHWQTQSGAEVYFAHAAEIPMLDIRIAFDAGSARDGQFPGLAFLTNTVLGQSTQQKNTDEIAERFANNGAQFDQYIDRDKAVIALRTLIDNEVLESNIQLTNELLTQANFPKEIYDRVKKQTIASIQEREQSPALMADDAMFAKVYLNHPYAHSVMGNIQSIEKITLKNLKDFYQRYYVGKNATIVLVGAIDQVEAKRISEVLTHQLISGKKPESIPMAVNTQKGIIHLSHQPSSHQTAIRIAQVGIHPSDIRYFPLLVGNQILGGGGGLNSRLSKEVREKNGLTYGIYSIFDLLKSKGPFIVRFETRNQQAKNALNIALQTIQTFIEQGPSEQELNDAKNYLIGSFPLRLDSNQAMTETLLKIGFYQMPLDYLDDYITQVQSVTLTQVKDAWRNTIYTHYESM